MSVTISQIATNVATVKLNVGEDTVSIDYYPGRVTEKTMSLADTFSGSSESTILDGFKQFNAELANLIKSWDVMEDDNTTMFPIDASRFAELPIVFRMNIFLAIVGDIRPEAMTA